MLPLAWLVVNVIGLEERKVAAGGWAAETEGRLDDGGLAEGVAEAEADGEECAEWLGVCEMAEAWLLSECCVAAVGAATALAGGWLAGAAAGLATALASAAE